MSKTLLSRIKPLTTPHSPITPNLKKQVNDTVHLLKTNPNWSNLLDDQQLLDISPLVFDRIHDVETGVKLFDWFSNRRKDELFSNGLACSSFLKLLARHRVLDEIEHSLGSLREEGVKITHEALSHILHAVLLENGDEETKYNTTMANTAMARVKENGLKYIPL